MNAQLLQSKLENKPDKIFDILESIGFTNIKYNQSKNNFRFAREENRNPTSCILDCETLRFYVFSTNAKGNLFTLIMDSMRCTFPQALEYAASVGKISHHELNLKVRYPFNGFYLKLIPNRKEDDDILQTYPEEILTPYLNKFNKMFIDDGISIKTQKKFGVGFDVETQRITIPERSTSGELVGIMGRANYDCDHKERWLPIISCSRSKTLYGYVNNYKRIQETGTVILFESEKAVQQCDSFGLNSVLASCGCHVSNTQAKYIQKLYPKKVIIAYDEGLEEEQLIEECKKIKVENPILSIKTGYIWDNSELIPKGSKLNIADLGLNACKRGLSKYVKWV